MSDEVFILRAKTPLQPEQPFYAIPGLKTELLQPIGRLIPTEASILSRILEWVIPSTPHNRAWVARHYSHFKVLKLEEAQQMPTAAPASEKPPEDGLLVEVDQGMTDAQKDFFVIPQEPGEIKTLKSKIMGKLTELGISAPKNSTLSTLQELLRTSLK